MCLERKKKTKKSLWFSLLSSIFFTFYPITPDGVSELELLLGGWVALHSGGWDEGVRCCYDEEVRDACSQLPSYKHTTCAPLCAWEIFWAAPRPTTTTTTTTTASPSPLCAAALMSIWIDGGASRRSHRMRACDWCNERVAVNKQRRALALMKACCNLFCRMAERERSPRSRWQTFSLVKLGILKGSAHWSDPARAKQRADALPWRWRKRRRNGGPGSTQLLGASGGYFIFSTEQLNELWKQ